MKILLIFSILLTMSCSESITFDQVKTKIKAQNEKLHQVVKTKNVDLLKEVYAEDANFMAPGAGLVQGRDSIIALWKSGLNDILDMHSTTLDIGGTTDVVYEVGIVENKIRTQDSAVVYRAKYSNVWVRDSEGVYRLTVDIWNRIE